MSRVEIKSEQFSMAFGVDQTPMVGAFVQVWDHTKGDDSELNADSDDAGFNQIEVHNRTTTGGKNLTEEFVIGIARKYKIPIDETEVYRIFD